MTALNLWTVLAIVSMAARRPRQPLVVRATIRPPNATHAMSAIGHSGRLSPTAS